VVDLPQQTRSDMFAYWSSSPIAQGESIQMDHLCAPGKNRWLSVLVSLLIWREWLGDRNMGDWDTAVADVH